MPFLGVQPTDTFAAVAKQTITGDGSTTYTLTHSVASANDLAVFVNNVRQEPTTAYSASGTSITFTEAIASTDSCYVVYIARTFQTVSPPDNSVNADQISYPLTNFSSTGIDDNADATAITIDSNEKVGVGIATPLHTLSVKGSQATGLKVESTGSSSWVKLTNSSNSAYVGNDSGSLLFQTNETTRMSILQSGGVTFNGDTAAANALDDYEEGTWNVTLGDGTTTSGTLTTGRYTKIGQVVIARFDALNNINTAGFGTNQNVHISLPFTSSSTGRSTGSVIVDSIDFNSRTSVCSKVPDSTSNALLTLIGSNLGDGAVKWSYLSSGASDIVDFCLVYTA